MVDRGAKQRLICGQGSLQRRRLPLPVTLPTFSSARRQLREPHPVRPRYWADPEGVEDRAVEMELLADRDPEEARQAAAEVDRIREENRRRFGDQPIGVAIIREFRGPLPE